MVKAPNNKTEKFLSGSEFRVWRLARGYSLPQAGQLLGVSPQAVALAEKNGLSRKDALAIAAIDAKLDPYEITDEDLVAAVLFKEFEVTVDKATSKQIREAQKIIKLSSR